jgi:hypothetical protein
MIVQTRSHLRQIVATAPSRRLPRQSSVERNLPIFVAARCQEPVPSADIRNNWIESNHKGIARWFSLNSD